MKETKNIKIIWPNNKETFVSDGDDWFSSAEKAGLEIPTGCLTGSCGACEIDVNGETMRACISEIKKNKNLTTSNKKSISYKQKREFIIDNLANEFDKHLDLTSFLI